MSTQQASSSSPAGVSGNARKSDAPIDCAAIELNWNNKRGQIIAAKWWQPPNARAAVVLVHGLGDHCGRYGEAIRALTQHGIAILAADLHGHGRSDGRRGYAIRFGDLIDDVRRAVDQARQKTRAPLFLYGHSMGGNLAARIAIEQPSLAGLILTSPLLRLTTQPPWWKIAAGCLLYPFPHIRMRTGIRAEQLSADPEVQHRYRVDPLRHGWINARMYFGMLRSADFVLRNAKAIRCPVLLMHGSADPITCWQASERFAAATNATWKVWPDMRHELHNEQHNELVLQTIVDWIVARNRT